MSALDNHQPHGHVPLTSPATLFINIPNTEFEEVDLVQLSVKMIADKDAPKDERDDEEGHIPAAYTYLGQFIDHDLSFDPSTFQQTKRDKVTGNLRTPSFDLDNVYGRGPTDQPYFYDGIQLIEGEKLFVVQRNPLARDVPRSAVNSRGVAHAIIGDPRNDENVIVSQLQGMFFRFHNRLAKENPLEAFSEVQKIVRWHYQWIVLHDFLPLIVHRSVLDRFSPAIVDPSQGPIDFGRITRKYEINPIQSIPIEFSTAAYRMGHSMVRAGYRLNEFTGPLPIFDEKNPTAGLNAFGQFPRSWAIDWNRFIDLSQGPADPFGINRVNPTDRTQFAYKIDTSIVDPLGHLPPAVAGPEAQDDPRLKSLTFRNLKRGNDRGLPSGQDVARYIGVEPLTDDEILIGPAFNTAKVTPILEISPNFKGKCPLFTYVLAEARKNFTVTGQAQLGDVGGTIIAETFLGIIQNDPESFPNQVPGWRPSISRDGNFTFADFLNYALGR